LMETDEFLQYYWLAEFAFFLDDALLMIKWKILSNNFFSPTFMRSMRSKFENLLYLDHAKCLDTDAFNTCWIGEAKNMKHISQYWFFPRW
jgi:hypothetical protein